MASLWHHACLLHPKVRRRYYMKINTYQKGKRRLSMVPARGNYKIKPAREKFIKNYIRMGV